MKYIDDLIDLLSIPSVYDASSITVDQPYGKPIALALDFMKDCAISEGFETQTFDGHALAIKYGNQSERIDIVSHLDVVHAKEGWHHDPFSPIENEGKLYARGTQDMKSLALLMFYVLKDIKDNNIELKKQVRLVYGTDEERTMKDIEYYIDKAGEPDFAFTPDGYFPFSIGEKGALMWLIEGQTSFTGLEMKGGVQCNVISPICTVRLPTSLKNKVEQVINQIGINPAIKVSETNIEITFTGKAAHASKPELGHNANIEALKFLTDLNIDPRLSELYLALNDPYGKGSNIDIETHEMGKLTLNLGIITILDNKIYCEVDCRYPFGIQAKGLTTKLCSALECFQITLPYDAKPVLNSMESPYLQVLLKQYQMWSNDYREPVVSGGVTYAKVIKNCVAFGPMLEEVESLAHQKDESIELKYLESLFPLYRKVIIELANL